MAKDFGVPYLGSLPVDPLLSQVCPHMLIRVKYEHGLIVVVFVFVLCVIGMRWRQELPRCRR